MAESARGEGQPLIVIANRDEWFARSVDSALSADGYAVTHTTRGRDAVRIARRARPDAIILGLDLEDPDAYTVCRELRDAPEVTHATPIILSTTGPTTRQQRLDALRAGAWHLRAGPVDAEEFALQLSAFVRAKLDADRIGEEGLIDRSSGLYNRLGLTRRARELSSQTRRQHLPLACVVFALEDDEGETALADRLAQALRESGRVSDAIGRVGKAEFAIFAPATDQAGAERLTARLSASMLGAVAAGGSRLRSAHRVATTAAPGPIDPLDLLDQTLGSLRGNGPAAS
jgi:DNA-binding response OmpR family regulator